ncbi:EamA family transporter [bacterium SCSIO 12741]|nr:EamA family transporter [bacterium SCSIO 12741]
MSQEGFFTRYQNHIAIHVIVLIWGFTGILGKVISIPFYSLVWFRMAIAFLSLIIYFKLFRKGGTISLRYIPQILGVGLLVAAHWAAFFEALKVSTVSVVLTTLASTSLFVALIEPLFFKRRVRLYEVIFGVIVISGLFLIFQFEADYHLGIMLSLLAALLAALFGVINGRLVEKAPPGQITLYEMLGGVLGISIYTVLFENWSWADFQPTSLDWIYLLVLGVICTAVAFVVSVQVLRELSPFTVSMSINMEPIYAIILALIFFGDSERMTPGFYAGALLILGTVLANGLVKARINRKNRRAD